MGPSDRATDPSVRLTFLEAIDPVCVAFEVTCQETGRPPRIEDFLKDYAGAERQWLLRELLLLELEYLRRRGEAINPSAYQKRFADDDALVARLFQRHAETLCRRSSADTVSGPAPPPPPVVNEKQFGKYTLLELLGEGGMGVVYRAQQEGVEREVALKLIRPERLAAMNPQSRGELVARFHEEIKAAAKLDHDHIVRVYDVGEHQNRPYFAMQFIRGHSLDELLEEGTMAGDEAAALLEPVCAAIHAAHEGGIVHRDIKPSNILVDDAGKPYVADFGLAKLCDTDQSLTQTGQLLGTPPYMSPQQVKGETLTPASDVYSLGATLYEMLAGRPPFKAASIGETLRQVLFNEPAPPSRINPDVDRDIESVCLKCLEKDPARRYESAADLAADLHRYRFGQMVTARPLTAPVRAARWCRRNPLVATAIGGAAALALMLLAMLSWFAIDEWQDGQRYDDLYAQFALEGESSAEFEQRIGELGTRVENLQSENKGLVVENAALTSDKDVAKARAREAEGREAERAKNLVDAQSKFDEANGEITILKGELASAFKTIRELEDRLAKMPPPMPPSPPSSVAPAPEDITLTTADGVILKLTYWEPGKPGKSTVPVILLHGWKGRRQDYETLAEQLQTDGHVVVSLDLRGHGESLRLRRPDRRIDETIDPERMNKGDFESMIVDVQSAKSFLMEKHRAGKLNIELLCIVGADMGALVAMNFAHYDWTRPIVPVRRFNTGQDVRALVLLSPPRNFRGLTYAGALRNPGVNKLSTMIVVGDKDSYEAYRDAKYLYSSLEAFHAAMPRDVADKAAWQAENMDLFLLSPTPSTNLQGTGLLGQHLLSDVDEMVLKFIEIRLTNKAHEHLWAERE